MNRVGPFYPSGYEEPWLMTLKVERTSEELECSIAIEYHLLWALGNPVCCFGWPYRGKRA